MTNHGFIPLAIEQLKTNTHWFYNVCYPDNENKAWFIAFAIGINKTNIGCVSFAIGIIKQNIGFISFAIGIQQNIGFITFTIGIILKHTVLNVCHRKTKLWFYCVCRPDNKKRIGFIAFVIRIQKKL